MPVLQSVQSGVRIASAQKGGKQGSVLIASAAPGQTKDLTESS